MNFHIVFSQAVEVLTAEMYGGYKFIYFKKWADKFMKENCIQSKMLIHCVICDSAYITVYGVYFK